jgi:hypothetical protein
MTDGKAFPRGTKRRHGTPSGYNLHQELGQDPCAACYEAKQQYDKRAREAPEKVVRSRLKAQAQRRALYRIKDHFPDLYYQFYEEEKARVYRENGLAY